ncbi:hypothetical protein Hanom_Chr04g00335171 [Helianthus anomalus]
MFVYLVWTSSLPLILFMTHDMPALTPVITAKLRAWMKGPPARACNTAIGLKKTIRKNSNMPISITSFKLNHEHVQ